MAVATMNKMKLPQCCKQPMDLKNNMGKFVEAHCNICGDIIYIKRHEMTKPQMLDD